MISFMFAPRPSQIKTGVRQQDLENALASDSSTEAAESDQISAIEVFADNLNIPWEIEFLPDNSLLITQRSGQLLRINANSQEQIEIEGVEHVGEGGLLGLTLHPEFEENGWLYLYLTTRTDNGLINRVERYIYDMSSNQLSDKQEILSNIPGAQNHDGGRIAFGPDGLLYITTGDASQAGLAQDLDSLAGKILRLNPDGTVPAENPYNSPVYSYGHRNP
jgi:glucose/arabinose dehydrogenase